MDRKPTWVCTLVTQLCLCFALYVALNLGHPQNPIHIKSDGFYFISVAGGSRPFQQQTLLLKLIERVAKSYQVKFVVTTSELGNDDPLKQNITFMDMFHVLEALLSHSGHKLLNGYHALPISETSMVYHPMQSALLPGYTTRASKGQDFGCFQEQIKLPHGKTLDIIGMNTGSLQETMRTELSSGATNNQINWLTRTLETTNGNWCIVVGFQPLVVCKANKEHTEATRIYNSLHHIFMKFGVDMYLSKHGCAKYSRQDSVTYIENPLLIECANGTGTVDGFLLHRVSSLEMATFFVTSAGEIVNRTIIRQKGKEFM